VLSDQQTTGCQMIRRTLLLSLFLLSLWGSSACTMDLSSGQNGLLEYTQAQPYLLHAAALEFRAKQTGDLHRQSDVLVPDRLFAAALYASAPVGRIVRAIDPPIHTHLIARQLASSGL
jgi:hypothetical protein